VTARTWGKPTGAGTRKAKEERLARARERTPSPPPVAYHRTRPRSPDRPPPPAPRDRHARPRDQISARLPPQLAEDLRARAEREGVAVRQVVLRALERELYGTPTPDP
jgi:hypothetical protein